MIVHRFSFPGFRGGAAPALAKRDDLESVARTLLDAAAATATVHWGRNYIYRAAISGEGAPIDCAVKQFRGGGSRERRRRARGDGKARRSFEVATALLDLGFDTPEPLAWIESDDPSGVSCFVSRFLAPAIELRYLLRARAAGEDLESFATLPFSRAISAVGRTARRLHDAGVRFRDFSVGNLLLVPGEPDAAPRLFLVDLNRVWLDRRLSTAARMRELCRLPLPRPEDREALLAEYWGGATPDGARLAYEAAVAGFRARERTKRALRAPADLLRRWLLPRGTHSHIPPAPEAAARRDKTVWDALSDQPHQHASRGERALVRLADLPHHLRAAAALAVAAPRIVARYRALGRTRRAAPNAPATSRGRWPGVGVALRPWTRDPAALLALVDRLGARQVLLRLHPWETSHDAEEALAAELSARGLEITFALPQDRSLVRDLGRWRVAVERLADRFVRYGSRFQIGQAINRSKWGVWNYDEYLALAAVAAEVLRARGRVELAGPAVIDFEIHALAAVVNLPRAGLEFDALSALLYVDRRGAPENRQLGFATEEKVRWLRAIAETARLVTSPRVWITEVNWPLREGPHSPAGKSVAVDEDQQASFLSRYYLLALSTGWVERCFWWQLVAKGYGLVDVAADGALRPRASFLALATLARRLDGAEMLGDRPAPPGARVLAFAQGGEEIWAAWSTAAPVRLDLGGRRGDGWRRDGEAFGWSESVELGGAPVFLRFA